MKRVIINADDFGLSSGVNRGIIRAYRDGILTSTTLMANMDSFTGAVELSKENPGLGIGIHLNLLRGAPVSPGDKIPSLLKNGCFPGNAALVLKKVFSREIDLLEVEKEWRAQIEKVLRAGVTVTHFDSEKHLHCLPPLFRVTIKLACEFNIKCVRYIKEPFPPLWFSKILDPQFLKLCFLNCCCKRVLADFDTSALKRTDSFFGVFSSGKMGVEEYEKIFSKTQKGVTEIMCHPGFKDNFEKADGSYGSYYINNSREMELAALLASSLKVSARENGIDFIDFGDIK